MRKIAIFMFMLCFAFLTACSSGGGSSSGGGYVNNNPTPNPTYPGPYPTPTRPTYTPTPDPTPIKPTPTPTLTEPTPTEPTPTPSPTPTVGEVINFGAYTWRVLEVKDGKALILSDKIIEKRVWDAMSSWNSWHQCDLRTYLNGEFYNKFNATDKARIIETTNITKPNPWGGPSVPNTNDKIFVLSIEEVLKYFGDSGKYNGSTNPGFISDQYNSARIATYNGAASMYWLRTPGSLAGYVITICSIGTLTISGNPPNRADIGVRPAGARNSTMCLLPYNVNRW